VFNIPLVTVCALLSVLFSSNAGATERPNFVFIMTDDQAADAVGYKGRYSWLETPNIDRLAAEGAVFENFFVSTSLCSPSRAAILTGAYGHINGVTYNEQSDPQIPIFPSMLQVAGYQTAYIGKWHMAHHARPRAGFDYWLSFKGQGTYTHPKLNVNGVETQIEGYTTDLLTDYAEAWLRTEREGAKPFCLFVMHKANHDPMTPAPRHVDAWPGQVFSDTPESFASDMSDRPAWQRHAARYGVHNEVFHQNRDQPTPARIAPTNWDDWPLQKKMMNHLRCILAVDESVGRIYETLKAIGELDNTVLVFTSDNGYFLGEHRRNDKRLAYEESIRVPFVMRYPAVISAGTMVDASCMNIDVAPTFLELAGAERSAQFQGLSLLPVLNGETPADWRDYIFYQYFQETYAPGIPTMLAVRTDRWKYIHHPDLPGDIGELFDLTADPKEMRNLYLHPEYALRLKEMQTLLQTAELEFGYDTPIEPQY
jgi:N-acetylglucosamine-6-sulfatase